MVAGALLGCLVFKPQLGVVAGVVLLLAGHWRMAGAALASAVAQLAVGWMVAGSAAMGDYVTVLWRLARDPSLVQLHPSEVHSLRGFLQLLTSSGAVIDAGALAGMIVALFAGVTAWRSRAPGELRWSLIVLLTVLASPHLLTYDLVLLTIPLLILPDWGVCNRPHPLLAGISGLLILIYLSPFSSNVARLIGVQLSTVAMAGAAWCLYRLCTAPSPIDRAWMPVTAREP
jgi:hypothetical protein